MPAVEKNLQDLETFYMELLVYRHVSRYCWRKRSKLSSRLSRVKLRIRRGKMLGP